MICSLCLLEVGWTCIVVYIHINMETVRTGKNHGSKRREEKAGPETDFLIVLGVVS